MNIIKKVLQTLGFLWIFAVVITQAHAQATSPAAPPAVESANIMDIPKGSDAAAQREREQTQPANNSPFWRALNSDQAHYVSIPDKEAGVLIQKGGQEWRLIRNGVITVFGGWLIVLIAVAILAFYYL